MNHSIDKHLSVSLSVNSFSSPTPTLAAPINSWTCIIKVREHIRCDWNGIGMNIPIQTGRAMNFHASLPCSFLPSSRLPFFMSLAPRPVPIIEPYRVKDPIHSRPSLLLIYLLNLNGVSKFFHKSWSSPSFVASSTSYSHDTMFVWWKW